MKTDYQKTLDKKYGIKSADSHPLFPTKLDIKLHERIRMKFTRDRIIGFLTVNPENRDVKKSRVETWEFKLLEGDFHDNSCTIEVAENPATGKLILSGGQHKLYAMLDMGYFDHFFDVRRVSWEERTDSNTGDLNTMADNFAMEYSRAYSYYDANCVYSWLRNERRDEGKKLPKFVNAARIIADEFQKNGLKEFVDRLQTKSTNARTGRIVSTGVYGAIIGHFVKDPSTADALVEFILKYRQPDLMATQNGKAADPAYALEQAVNRFQGEHVRTGQRRADPIYVATKYVLENYLGTDKKVTASEISRKGKLVGKA